MCGYVAARVGATTVFLNHVCRANGTRQRRLSADRTPGVSLREMRTADLSGPDFIQAFRSSVQVIPDHRSRLSVTVAGAATGS